MCGTDECNANRKQPTHNTLGRQRGLWTGRGRTERMQGGGEQSERMRRREGREQNEVWDSKLAESKEGEREKDF